MIFYVETSGALNTNSSNWTPLPGLSLKLPRAAGEFALVILNVPQPYASGSDFPGGEFSVDVDGGVVSPFATFTYNEQHPQSTGRVPVTLCVRAPLNQSRETPVIAVWKGVRGSTVHIDSPSSLSAVI